MTGAPAVSFATRVLLDPLLAVVFPSRCPACAQPLERPSQGPLCLSCWDALPRHALGQCDCGSAVTAPLPCGRCRRGLSPFASGASLGPFEGALRAALHALKYDGRRRVAGRLASALLAEPAVLRTLATDAVLVPVPLHPSQKRRRGFNQAELLARELLRRHGGLQLADDVLVRRRDTPSQTGLTAAARRRNVEGAFAVRHRSRLAGRRVVLVDDVLTTGATARECARTLRRAGARDVTLLTVARVP